jgi:hypothetical protein
MLLVKPLSSAWPPSLCLSVFYLPSLFSYILKHNVTVNDAEDILTCQNKIVHREERNVVRKVMACCDEEANRCVRACVRARAFVCVCVCV